MNTIRDLVKALDTIANEIEEQDERIALSIDRVSDGIEKRAFFNQSTWLPGRCTRAYPNRTQNVPSKNDKSILYVCSSCNLRRHMIAYKRCPRCGHLMYKFN